MERVNMGAYRWGPEDPMHSFLAYLDPGSGSLLFQALVASVVAVPFLLRHHIGRFVGAIRGRKVDAVTRSVPTETAQDH